MKDAMSAILLVMSFLKITLPLVKKPLDKDLLIPIIHLDIFLGSLSQG